MSVRRRAALFAVLVCVGMTSAGAFAQRHKQAPPPAGPTDAQIVHIAATASEIDVRAAQLALKTSKNKEVRQFAAAMVRDHKKINDQAAVVARGLLLRPEDNPTSKALVLQAKESRERLVVLKGAAFDKAYVANEVAYHKAVNAALGDTLIPATKAPELKAFLQDGLALFQAHQQHAEAISAKMP